MNSKIIGIGFQKTGTSSLRAALEILGYSVLGPRTDLAEAVATGDWKSVFKNSDSYDALEDNPWAIIYKVLDEKYPNSKFILTIRDETKWIKSVVNHFGGTTTNMREYIYGSQNGDPVGNEEIYLKRYRQHINDVEKYFSDRPKDLLIMSMDKGFNWNEICTFLDCKIPGKPFPHTNKGAYNWNEKVLKIIKNFLRPFVKIG